jgi:acyl-CoA synthetase (AMP-forming)/AMP-acid ligase II
MRIEKQTILSGSPAEVWKSLGDPVALGRFSDQLHVERQPGTDAPGIGARYRVMLTVGAVPVGGNVEVIVYEPERELQWTTITGVDHRMRLRLRETDDGGTRLTLRFAYDSPGIFGTVADLASYVPVSHIMDDLLASVAGHLESRPAKRALPNPLTWAAHEAGNAVVLAKAGIIAPINPAKLPRLGLSALKFGASLATGVSANAVRHPDAAMVIDEDGELSWRDVDHRTDALAAALRARGVKPGDGVGVMARNGRAFVESAIAVAKVGADVLLLNTAFAGPQLADVCDRESAVALIHDDEFAEALDDAASGRIRIQASELEQLCAQFAGQRPPRPGRAGRLTILTSGTTGTPKGAQRGSGGGLTLDAPAGFLSLIPMRAGTHMVIAAPLFHGWGLAHFGLALGLGSTMILRRRFDPEKTLADIANHRAEVLAVVPVMLQRILELPAEVRGKYDVSSLQVVASSGSPVSGELAARWMDAFGDNLYNLYGSTEVSFASIATPTDMRRAPGTVGRPPRGVTVKLFDHDGVEVPQGEVGRVFVGSSMLFEGYTGGGDKDRIHGLAATGDLGRLDEAGRLFIEGRDDEMIVSGGENVFPKEVEETLASHPAVVEAAAIGVPDDAFGQRLRAFVVLRSEVGEDAMKQHIRDHLANYKVPRDIVVLDELPRNATGKVVKRDLEKLP